MDEIAVSIVCNTYNQKNYIADALDGFLNQKTNFRYEILIHDDASTDGTAEIIREYEKKYPDLIYPIYQTENQYSQKVSISVTYQFPRARGKYIALCEGDDYWIDEGKLQKQYDAMEATPTIGICAHSVYGVNAESKEVIKTFSVSDRNIIIPVEKIITGGYIGTCSLFFKKSAVYPHSAILQCFCLDYFLRIQGSLEGGMLYHNEVMGCYRMQAEGSWTKTRQNNHTKIVSHINRIIECLKIVDKETERKYHRVIQRQIKKHEILATYRQICKVEKKGYLHLLSRLSWPQRFTALKLAIQKIVRR